MEVVFGRNVYIVSKHLKIFTNIAPSYKYCYWIFEFYLEKLVGTPRANLLPYYSFENRVFAFRLITSI